MVSAKKAISNPALYQQLDESSWMMTPPGAHRKRLGEYLKTAVVDRAINENTFSY
jgi:hypothetical protein